MTGTTQRSPLASYLADRDIPCHSCGYNLRGCTDPMCPECGTVIPKPLNQDRHQALRCLSCGYELGPAPLERCPECGSDDIFLGVRHGPPSQMPAWLRPIAGRRLFKGVPRTLWLAAVASLAFGIPLIAQHIGRTALTGAAPPLFLTIILGRILLAACTFAPAIAALLWFAFRKELNSTPLPTRARIALVTLLGSGSLSALSWLGWL